jgi:hypothetical protein
MCTHALCILCYVHTGSADNISIHVIYVYTQNPWGSRCSQQVQGVLQVQGAHVYTSSIHVYTSSSLCIHVSSLCNHLPLEPAGHLAHLELVYTCVYSIYIYSNMYIIDTLAYIIRKLCLQYIYTILRSGRGVWEGSVCVYIYYMYVCVLFTCTHYIQAPVYNMCIYK